MDLANHQTTWHHLAKRFAARVNLGWFLQMLTTPLIVTSLLGGGILIYFRYLNRGIPTLIWIALTLALLSSTIIAWFRARPHFLDPTHALIRLDADLSLHNALSTAAAGRGPWPAPPDSPPRTLTWNFGHVLTPLISALVFLLLGTFVPISPAQTSVTANQPYTWTQLENNVEQLIEQETIRKDYAEELKKRLEELRDQKAQEWFSAASLEATENLRSAHKNEIKRLQREIRKMERGLQQMANPNSTEEQRHKIQQQFADSLDDMLKGKMKPNPELLKKLAKAAQDALGNLTPEERAELEKQLREKAQELADALGEPGADPQEGDREGPPGKDPEQGGPNQGPGGFSGLYGDSSDPLKLKKFERLDSEKEPENEPGDLLQLEETEHQPDLSPRAPTTSGSAKSQGTGGDRVWKDALDPSEQRSLKNFFE